MNSCVYIRISLYNIYVFRYIHTHACEYMLMGSTSIQVDLVKAVLAAETWGGQVYIFLFILTYMYMYTYTYTLHTTYTYTLHTTYTYTLMYVHLYTCMYMYVYVYTYV